MVTDADDTDLKTLERALRKDEEQMSKVSEKKQDLEQRLYASRYDHWHIYLCLLLDDS